MVRPLRIEYPGAGYHVTAGGGERIAHDDADRALFLAVLGAALVRFDAQAWAYCLMDNHYRLLLHTRQANLSRLMRQIAHAKTCRAGRYRLCAICRRTP